MRDPAPFLLERIIELVDAPCLMRPSLDTSPVGVPKMFRSGDFACHGRVVIVRNCR